MQTNSPTDSKEQSVCQVPEGSSTLHKWLTSGYEANKVTAGVEDGCMGLIAGYRLPIRWHFHAGNLSEAGDVLLRLRESRPDLILLDSTTSGMRDWDVCREMRGASDAPMIVLSVRNTEREKVFALDLGCGPALWASTGPVLKAQGGRWEPRPHDWRAALALDAVLVSNDQSFTRIKKLKVEDWTI
jgi:CheY-like chemotaxis protein